jgi:hypothetical protein
MGQRRNILLNWDIRNAPACITQDIKKEPVNIFLNSEVQNVLVCIARQRRTCGTGSKITTSIKPSWFNFKTGYLRDLAMGRAIPLLQTL